MNSRGKTQIAIISVVVLLLAMLFAFRTVDHPASGNSPHDGGFANSDNDLAAKRAPVPAVATTKPGIASSMPFSEQTPAPESSGGDTGALWESRAVAGNATATANPVPDEKPEARPGTVAAECWGLRGDTRLDYVVTLDRQVHTSGEASALIAAQRESSGYATMFQTSSATPLRGKRVEFSLDIRTQGATRGANLLLRAEDAGGRTVAFDNMQSYGPDGRPDQIINRGVKGNTEWSTQHVVVDIPDDARVITYGVSLFGGGKAWIDNARIEVVSNDMATTAIQSRAALNGIPIDPASLTRSPRNLEFDLEMQAGAAPCN